MKRPFGVAITALALLFGAVEARADKLHVKWLGGAMQPLPPF
jgi:hypothetical protein